MKTGLDRLSTLFNQHIKRNSQIALLCNQASVNNRLEHIIDIVLKRKIKPLFIFSPEHGLYGVYQDMVKVKDIEQYRGIPVISLYGDSFESLSPTESYLNKIDTLIVDLFDIGTRFYTFAATMILFMRKASGRDIHFIVCDKPNPISGTKIEGNGVDEQFKSFVGLINIPVRHSLTLGELALYVKEIERLDIKLTIIKNTGYERSRYLDYYTDVFIPPSPNMPSLNTALVYPLGCLFEGTNISEGRGTTRPFEIFGADFIDPYLLAKDLNSIGLKGIYFRPIYFMPKFHKFADKICGGIFLHITDRDRFMPYTTGIIILHAIRRIYQEKLIWRTEPYEFVDNIPAIDLLLGNDKIRLMIDKQEKIKYIIEFIREEERGFTKSLKDFWIYKEK